MYIVQCTVLSVSVCVAKSHDFLILLQTTMKKLQRVFYFTAKY
jgi:hypothetical protein